MKIYVVWCWDEKTNTDETVGFFRTFEKARERMLANANHDKEEIDLRHADMFFKYGEEEGAEARLYDDGKSIMVDDEYGAWRTKYWIREEELA